MCVHTVAVFKCKSNSSNSSRKERRLITQGKSVKSAQLASCRERQLAAAAGITDSQKVRENDDDDDHLQFKSQCTSWSCVSVSLCTVHKVISIIKTTTKTAAATHTHTHTQMVLFQFSAEETNEKKKVRNSSEKGQKG